LFSFDFVTGWNELYLYVVMFRCDSTIGNGASVSGGERFVVMDIEQVGEPMRAVLLGHSYVRRLSEYMEADGNRKNLGLDPAQVEVRCLALGGATVRDGGKCVRHLLHDVLAFRSSIIYIHVGENDVGNLSSNSMVSLLLDLVARVKSVREMKWIVVSHSFPFPVFNESEKNVVRQVNVGLKTALKHQPAVCDS
jgi:hypothetical protein